MVLAAAVPRAPPLPDFGVPASRQARWARCTVERRDALKRRVYGGHGEALLERLVQLRELPIAQSTRAAMLSRTKGFEAALLVVATKLSEGRSVERPNAVRQPAEMALRILGELNENRVALKLLVVIEGADQGPTDENLCTGASYDDASSRGKPVA
jgi:hypothetical protein